MNKSGLIETLSSKLNLTEILRPALKSRLNRRNCPSLKWEKNLRLELIKRNNNHCLFL